MSLVLSFFEALFSFLFEAFFTFGPGRRPPGSTIVLGIAVLVFLGCALTMWTNERYPGALIFGAFAAFSAVATWFDVARRRDDAS